MNACTSEGRLQSALEILELLRKDLQEERLLLLKAKPRQTKKAQALESAEAHLARAAMYMKEPSK